MLNRSTIRKKKLKEEIFLHELSFNTLFLHPTNKNMTHVINFKKNVILIKEMEI